MVFLLGKAKLITIDYIETNFLACEERSDESENLLRQKIIDLRGKLINCNLISLKSKQYNNKGKDKSIMRKILINKNWWLDNKEDLI